MQVRNTPLLIDGDGEQMQVLVGSGGAGVYYGPSPALVTTNNAAAGATFTITAPFWIQSQNPNKAADLQLIALPSPTPGGGSLPGGGTTGQVLVKNSSADSDASWGTFTSGSGYLGDFTAMANGSAVTTNQIVSYSGDLYGRRTNGTIVSATAPNQDPTNWTKLTSNGLGYAINPTGAISESFPRYSATNPSLLALTSGTLQVTPLEVQLPANRVVMQVTVHSGDRAAVGQTHLSFAIFDAFTRALLAKTVDDVSTGWTADTTKTLALSAPWTPTVDTSVRVGVVQVATTTSRLVVPGASGIPAGLLTLTTLLGQTADAGLDGTPGTLPATYTASAVAQPFYAFVS